MSVIKIVSGDITKTKVDVIVNAANTSLLGGGGVDGAIHRIGGKEILEECQKIRNRQGGCKIGEAVITSAGKLPAKFVIHTVGPTWNGGRKNEELLLGKCYTNSLNLTVENNLESVAFPNISTGIYRFPKDLAAKIAFNSISEFIKKTNKLKRVYFVCYDNENYMLYQALFTNR